MSWWQRAMERGEVRPIEKGDAENEVLVAKWRKEGLPPRVAESWRSEGTSLELVPSMWVRGRKVLDQHKKNRVRN